MSRDSRSVLDRPAPGPDFTLRYGEHPEQIADVRLPRLTPEAHAPGGLVLFLHGGFWRQEYDRSHTAPLAAALAARGYTVVTPEYRRTGGAGGWPTTLDDVAAAVRRLPGLVRGRVRRDGAEDAGGLVLLAGHSAGGHLALWAAAEVGAQVGAAEVVALAPVADLRAAYDLDLDGGAVRDLLGGGPAEVPERYAATDPMARLPLGIPVAIVHGRRDVQVPVDLSVRFAAAAEQAGDQVLVDHPDCDHFAVIDPDSAAWSAVIAAFDQAGKPVNPV